MRARRDERPLHRARNDFQPAVTVRGIAGVNAREHPMCHWMRGWDARVSSGCERTEIRDLQRLECWRSHSSSQPRQCVQITGDEGRLGGSKRVQSVESRRRQKPNVRPTVRHIFSRGASSIGHPDTLSRSLAFACSQRAGAAARARACRGVGGVTSQDRRKGASGARAPRERSAPAQRRGRERAGELEE